MIEDRVVGVLSSVPGVDVVGCTYLVSEERNCLSCGAVSPLFSRESVPGQAGYDTSPPSHSLIGPTRPAVSIVILPTYLGSTGRAAGRCKTDVSVGGNITNTNISHSPSARLLLEQCRVQSEGNVVLWPP